MLTEAGCLKRRERLWASVPENVEWLLVADPRHVLYLSNFLVQPLSFSGGERGLLLLERDRGVTLIGDNFALRSATSDPFVDDEIMEPWYDHKNSVINRDHALLNGLKKVSERLYGRIGAVEAEWLPVGAWEVLGADHESHSTNVEAKDIHQSKRSVDLGTLLRTLRRHKEADEIALTKRCMKACDAGQARLREIIREGISEFEIYREIQNAALEAAGCPAIVYGDFRATNATNFKAGGLPTDYKLQAGDLFILDYSVVISGYRSDFTNTMAVTEPTPEQAELFAICQAAMASGEAAIKAGIPAAELYRAVQKPFVEAGKADLFPHHAGHGIGLAHPEAPIIVPHSEDIIQEGDIITIEPGAYLEGVGGMRIEHNYLVTTEGYERLSNHEISIR